MAGRVEQEMEQLLIAAFSPTRLELINDSSKHAGHSGDDGSGESHFHLQLSSQEAALGDASN